MAPPDLLHVSVGTTRPYGIQIGPDASHQLPPWLEREKVAGRFALVTDSVVAPVHARTLLDRMTATGLDTTMIIIPAGEVSKTRQTKQIVEDEMLERGLGRDAAVVAMGGGVVADLAGFVAATYSRGIPFVQVPTTLLAMVDASVGGKTGVDHPKGKNLIGAFHQPSAVITDTDTLSTLPERELRAGFAEIVKAALIADAAFFSWLEANAASLLARDAAALAHAIRRACEIKAAIVAEDEREQGRRALLNLGHSFAHAIEAGAGYERVLHGEAVATGLVLAAELSARTGRLPGTDVLRIRELLSSAGLPVDPPRLGRQRMLDLMGMDKKVADGQLRLVLLDAIGAAAITADYPRDALETLLAERAGA